MSLFSARRMTPELMDDPAADRDDLDRSLKFIERVNRRLGGTAAALNHLKRWSSGWSRDETIRILDIGTGAADIPLAIAQWASGAGFNVQITGIDLHETTLQLARQRAGGRDGIELIRADALKLTEKFEANAFDYAHAGMFLHHLPDIEVMTVLRIMHRLTRRAIIWNDLVRGPIEKAAIRLMTIGAPAMVRHDAVVSVEKGFTRREVLECAQRVGLPAVRFHRHLFGRFTLTSEKP